MAIDHKSLHARYCQRIFSRHESMYLSAPERDAFLAAVKVPLLRFLSSAAEDCYFAELIEIYTLGQHFQESEEELLRKAEKCRKKWAGQYFLGTEYNQPYIPVDELVREKHPRYITKFIVQCWTAQFFLKLILQLEKARKRGGLHEREEIKILREAKAHHTVSKAHSEIEVGFKWIGRSVQLRIATLFRRLYQEGYIHRQTSIQQFQDLFSGEPVAHPVIWLHSNKLLLYFTDRLIDHQLVKMPKQAEDFLMRKQYVSLADKADGLKHTISSWQYARVAACFLSKEKKPLYATKLKHQRRELDHRNSQPPGAAWISKLVKEIASLLDPAG